MKKWSLDLERIRAFAPFGVPVLIVVLGWSFLIRPAASENARAARELDALHHRLAQVRALANEPPPPPVADSPVAAFQTRVARRDASSQVVGELAALASDASAANLVIETGDRVEVAGPNAPQASGAASDPRFVLFETPLAYTPIEMSFDAPFSRVGEMLWNLRDFATTVEVRSVRVGRGAADVDTVHVELTLFVYAQQAPAAAGGAR